MRVGAQTVAAAFREEGYRWLIAHATVRHSRTADQGIRIVGATSTPQEHPPPSSCWVLDLFRVRARPLKPQIPSSPNFSRGLRV